MPLDSLSEGLRASTQADDQSHRGLLEEGIHDVASRFIGEERNADGSPTVRDQVEHYATELIKAVPLFMVGSRNAYLASALLYGLDQVHAGTSLATGMEDFALGATKGALTKGAFEYVGGKEKLNWAAKGVVLGASTRALDLGLTRSTYLDKSGHLDLSGGAANVLQNSLNYKSLAIDGITFGAAHYGLGKLNQVAANTFLDTKLAQNMTAGAFFGLTSGSLAEAQRQSASGEKFDLGKVLLRGGIEAGVMSLASVPGGLQRAHSLAMAPELAKSDAQIVSPSVAERSPTMFSGIKEKLSDSLALLRGDRLGLVYGSGDLPGENGELRRARSTRSDETPEKKSAKAGDGRSNRNYRTATDILRERSMADYADALREVPRLANLRAVRFLGFGDETQAAILLAPQKGLPEGGVLKISHFRNGWDPVWGTRPYDAKVLIPPQDITLPSSVDATVHVQETIEHRDRYAPEDVEKLRQQIRENGDEWQDPGSHDNKQVGYNRNGELKVIDYSAAGKPGDNETLQQLIYGRELVRQEEDDTRSFREIQHEREQEEEKQATGEMGSIDLDLEDRRQQVLDDSTRPAAEREILRQLFLGESVDDAATMWAVEKYNEDLTQNFDKLMKQGRKEVMAVKAKATKEGLFSQTRRASQEDDD